MSNGHEARSWQSVFRWIADNPPEHRDPRAGPLLEAAEGFMGLDTKNRPVPHRAATSTESDAK